ncbi:MAG: C1 family peptidase [Terriglobia bacterium]
MVTPKLGKGLGRIADVHDKRDYRINRLPHLGVGAPIPRSTDVFVGLDLPVYDQGTLGSCTANSGVLYRRFLLRKFAADGTPDEDLSRLFLYYQERNLPWVNAVQSDSGASIRDACYVLAHIGVCPEGDDPYVPGAFSSAAANNNPQDIADARAFRIGAYHRVPDGETVRYVLASGYGVILGFLVYPSFEDVGSNGILGMPRPGELPLGGHAVVIRGYDDARASFNVQNSWGLGWGDHGCFWMPYDYLDRSEVSQPDMWMGHLGRPWKAS